MINGRRIGVVLPAYNAAATLSRTVVELDPDVVDEIVLVDDEDIRAAMALIADTMGVLVEPSGAAGVAAVQRHPVPGERIAVLLTGAWDRPDWSATLSST